MSMRSLIAATSQLVNLINQLNQSGREISQQQQKKIVNLTNDEVFWIRAQAVMTGASGSIAGISTIAGSVVPDNARIGNLNAETIRSIAKSFGTGSQALGDMGSSFLRGESVMVQNKKSLIERCGLPSSQQEANHRDSLTSQLFQAVQATMSAKARGM